MQSFVITAIQGESESIIHTSYPAYPTGFPLIINIYNDLPILHINDLTIKPKSRLNITGQIHDANININGKFGQIGIVLHPTAPYYLFHKLC